MKRTVMVVGVMLVPLVAGVIYFNWFKDAPEKERPDQTVVATENKVDSYECEIAKDAVAQAQSGKWTATLATRINLYEKYCGKRLENKSGMLRLLAEAYLAEVKRYISEDLPKNMTVFPGWCPVEGDDNTLGYRFCIYAKDCPVSGVHFNFKEPLSYRSKWAARRGVSVKAVVVELLGSMASKTEDELIRRMDAAFRLTLREALINALRRYSLGGDWDNVDPEELVEALNELDPDGAEYAETLRQRVWARRALYVLDQLRRGNFVFPVSIDMADKVRKLLVSGNLQPEMIGTSEEELNKLSGEDPIIRRQ